MHEANVKDDEDGAGKQPADVRHIIHSTFIEYRCEYGKVQ